MGYDHTSSNVTEKLINLNLVRRQSCCLNIKKKKHSYICYNSDIQSGVVRSRSISADKAYAPLPSNRAIYRGQLLRPTLGTKPGDNSTMNLYNIKKWLNKRPTHFLLRHTEALDDRL